MLDVSALVPIVHYLLSPGSVPGARLAISANTSSGGLKGISQNLDSGSKNSENQKKTESGQKLLKIPLSCHYFEPL